MNNKPTSANFARWTRRMAEIEGWSDIRPYNGEDRPCDCDDYDIPSHFGWGEDQKSPLIGRPPYHISADWHLPDYLHNLNMLSRVCRAISEMRMGMMCLESCIRGYMSPRYVPASWFSQQACLTAEELFPIIGNAIDALDELDKDHVAPDTEKLNNEWWGAEIRNELRKARAMFPGAHNLTGALAEEAGEAIKEAMHFYNGEPSSRLHLIKECVQAAVVAIRLAEEGDPLFKVPKLDKANEH